MEALGSIATYIPVVVAVIAAISVVAAPVLANRADGLGRAERITKLATSLDEGPHRELMEDARDLIAARWVLRSLAPRHPILRASGLTAAFFAILLAVYVLRDGTVDWGEWQIYASYGCSLLAGFLGGQTMGRRASWVRKQLQRRGISESL